MHAILERNILCYVLHLFSYCIKCSKVSGSIQWGPRISLCVMGSAGLTLPLAIVAICYWKCRVATNISHWLKVQSRWFKNYVFAKKCILISFWVLLFLHTLCCQILLYGCLIFSLPSVCQTVWIQIWPDIWSGLIWVQTVCKGNQQTTKVPPSRQRVK